MEEAPREMLDIIVDPTGITRPPGISFASEIIQTQEVDCHDPGQSDKKAALCSSLDSERIFR